VAPAQYTFGNTGRTVAIGPGATISDLSLLKSIAIREQRRLQFRVEAMNFLNRANFGRINSLIGGNQARIIQLGLHYRF